jgi:Arc/MetJ-type ribon-helix-helix transcriptional regulator
MRTVTVELTDKAAEMADRLVGSETFESISDLFNQLIEGSQQVSISNDRLRPLIQEALESGPALELTDEDWAEMWRQSGSDANATA